MQMTLKGRGFAIMASFAIVAAFGSGCNGSSSNGEPSNPQQRAGVPNTPISISQPQTTTASPSPSPSIDSNPYVTELGKIEGDFIDLPGVPGYAMNSDGSITFVTQEYAAMGGSADVYILNPTQGIKQIFKDSTAEFDFQAFINPTHIFLATNALASSQTTAKLITVDPVLGSAFEIRIPTGGSFDAQSVIPGFGAVLASSGNYEIVQETGVVNRVTPDAAGKFVEIGYDGMQAVMTADHDLLLSSPSLNGMNVYTNYPTVAQTITFGTPKTAQGKLVPEYTFSSIPILLPSGQIVVEYTNAFDDGTNKVVSFSDQVAGIAVLKKNASGQYAKTELDSSNFVASQMGGPLGASQAVELDGNILVLRSASSVRYFDLASGKSIADFSMTDTDSTDNNEQIQSLLRLNANRVLVQTTAGLYILDSKGAMLAHVQSKTTPISALHELSDGRLIFVAHDRSGLNAMDPSNGTISSFSKFTWPATVSDPTFASVTIKDFGQSDVFGVTFSDYQTNLANNFAIVDRTGKTTLMNLADINDSFIPLQDRSGLIHIGSYQVELIKFP